MNNSFESLAFKGNKKIRIRGRGQRGMICLSKISFSRGRMESA